MSAPRQRAYWACQCAGWGTYALANAALFSSAGASARSLLWVFGASALGLGLTHALRAEARRRRWAELPILRLALRVVPVSVVLSSITALCGLAGLVAAGSADQLSAAGFFISVFNWSAVYFGWQLIYFAVALLRRSRRAELEALELRAAAHEATLRALKAQLDPHFLFNALNGIRAMIAIDPERARDLVTQLAALLRHALSGADTVTLGKELEVVRGYLAIEGARFDDRLRVSIEVPDEALREQVPTFLVQTLVENAIKHGIARLASGGEINISAWLNPAELFVGVRNTRAPPEPPAAAASTGLGLANARERLRLLFGDRASLLLDINSVEHTVALARLPRQPSATVSAAPKPADAPATQ